MFAGAAIALVSAAMGWSLRGFLLPPQPAPPHDPYEHYRNDKGLLSRRKIERPEAR